MKESNKYKGIYSIAQITNGMNEKEREKGRNYSENICLYSIDGVFRIFFLQMRIMFALNVKMQQEVLLLS